jgi:hypothetical protein
MSARAARVQAVNGAPIAGAVAWVVGILWLVEVVALPLGWRTATFQPLAFMVGAQILPFVSVVGALTNVILYRRNRSPGMLLAVAVPVASTLLLAVGSAILMVLWSGPR